MRTCHSGQAGRRLQSPPHLPPPPGHVSHLVAAPAPTSEQPATRPRRCRVIRLDRMPQSIARNLAEASDPGQWPSPGGADSSNVIITRVVAVHILSDRSWSGLDQGAGGRQATTRSGLVRPTPDGSLDRSDETTSRHRGCMGPTRAALLQRSPPWGSLQAADCEEPRWPISLVRVCNAPSSRRFGSARPPNPEDERRQPKATQICVLVPSRAGDLDGVERLPGDHLNFDLDPIDRRPAGMPRGVPPHSRTQKS